MSRIPNFTDKLQAKVNFRLALETGTLLMPSCISEPSEIEIRMWNALWANYLTNEGTTSTPYWFDQFADPRGFNQFIKKLSDYGWITSVVIPQRHWAEISLNKWKLQSVITTEELLELRKEKKFAKYQMKSDTNMQSSTRTRQNGQTRDTGLRRSGFALAGTREFKYDTVSMNKYREAIILNVTKSMRKIENIHELVEDGADYKSIASELVDYHMYSPDKDFTLGTNLNDSRGRAISSALSKVFNPIGFKDARALQIIPKEQVVEVREYTKAMYLFIAELQGIKTCGSESEKAKLGRSFYKAKDLPELDLDTEHGRDELHELIWLERVYAELDSFFSRDTSVPFYTIVPVELDASASMIQLTGVLLNHAPYMEMTNLTGSELADPWRLPELSRKHVKLSATPMLYGSSQTAQDLWTKNGLTFTTRQSALMSHEIRNGAYAVANDFKNIIIENVQPIENMEVQVWNEKFNIECNRFRNVGDYTRRYPIYDTESGQVLAIAHTHTHKVPDLKQFKRYFQTLLIHNLDSQIADFIAMQEFWCLTIHDAFICSAVSAKKVRTMYAGQIEKIYKDRESIINNYFKSIRLGRSAIAQWAELQKSIVPFTGNFKCNAMALK